EILAGPMFLVAVVGLLINMLVFWILTRGDKEHVNIKGAVLHVMGDLLGSVGAISAAIVIYFTGWTPIDPILSILVSVLILRSAWALLRNALHILLEGAPENAKPEEIQTYLMGA
ncbi:cation diffusion facilitator family transporter, partial [Escherichia coli]|nr:cation diffusion facilitator family transporter [Escherichia coli]